MKLYLHIHRPNPNPSTRLIRNPRTKRNALSKMATTSGLPEDDRAPEEAPPPTAGSKGHPA
jgi:hypothetical protein